MRVEVCTALAAVFLFAVSATAARAEDKPQAPAGAIEPATAESKIESRTSDSAAVVAQAPADPDAQVLANIKVYPCF